MQPKPLRIPQAALGFAVLCLASGLRLMGNVVKTPGHGFSPFNPRYDHPLISSGAQLLTTPFEPTSEMAR
jgi:hypothetical protein